MRLGVRQKLFVAFAGLYLLLTVVAMLAMFVINRVSHSTEAMFHENLESIRACREMESALQRMKEALLGESSGRVGQVRSFEAALGFQMGNVTLPGEQALTDSLASAWEAFRSLYGASESQGLHEAGFETYRALLPRFLAMEGFTRRIGELNSVNILSVDGRVKTQAESAHLILTCLLAGGGVLTLILLFLTGKYVLDPVRALTISAQEIERGNLDLKLPVRSGDELGILAQAFNDMAARLRDFRRSDQAKLALTQKTTQMAINSLSDAVAVFGSEGEVEMSNDPAAALFGIKPGVNLKDLRLKWLTVLFERTANDLRPFKPRAYEGAIQVFREGEERFFLPHAIPMLDEGHRLYGVTVVLADVTELRRLDESKSDLLATVSHELKTRLTSVRMAVHLLLDDKVGPVNGRQADLLRTAREDSEHLHRMIETLLDIGRIRSGRMEMEMKPMEPGKLIDHSLDVARQAFKEKEVRLHRSYPMDLPPVLADASRVHLVLGNLLSNALKYTPAGGTVSVAAERDGGHVRFDVADTGSGIPPEDLPRVFERFYRGSREGEPGGAGLGLAIAKEVAEAHGGVISVKSKEGVGSTFSFTLFRGPAS
jgi:NtrC-family two-component system sensor histidine kinase KinB